MYMCLYFIQYMYMYIIFSVHVCAIIAIHVHVIISLFSRDSFVPIYHHVPSVFILLLLVTCYYIHVCLHLFISCLLAKMTRCGHVYCFPCILHYLSLVIIITRFVLNFIFVCLFVCCVHFVE